MPKCDFNKVAWTQLQQKKKYLSLMMLKCVKGTPMQI